MVKISFITSTTGNQRNYLTGKVGVVIALRAMASITKHALEAKIPQKENGS